MFWHPYQELTPEEEKHLRKLLTDERFKASVNSCVKEIVRRLPECKGDNAGADLFDEMRDEYGDDPFTVAISMFFIAAKKH